MRTILILSLLLMSIVHAAPVVTSAIIASSVAGSNSRHERQQADAMDANEEALLLSQSNTGSVIEGVMIAIADYNYTEKGWDYNKVSNGLTIEEHFRKNKRHEADKIKFVLLYTRDWYWLIYYTHGSTT